MPRLNAYLADRYVIASSVNNGVFKLFQIAFSKKDGSIFVTFPYLKGCAGRLGSIVLPKGQSVFKNLTIDKDFPVTSHLVKYSHHPSGQAHFSLTGKVKTSIKRNSVPLSEIGGHIFTIKAQGFSKFAILEKNKKPTKSRGIVVFPYEEKATQSLQFVCHIYAESELAKIVNHKTNSPWSRMYLPNNRIAYTIPIATPFFHNNERRYLLISAERTDYFCTSQEEGISFMGGFDSESLVNDYSKDSGFLLMCINPIDNFSDIVKKFGTIDL